MFNVEKFVKKLSNPTTTFKAHGLTVKKLVGHPAGKSDKQLAEFAMAQQTEGNKVSLPAVEVDGDRSYRPNAEASDKQLVELFTSGRMEVNKDGEIVKAKNAEPEPTTNGHTNRIGQPA